MFKILLVEDESSDVLLFTMACQEAGYTGKLDTVTDGMKGLALLHQDQDTDDDHLPNLIVMDLGLPGLSGHEVLAAIRAHPRTSKMPVIVLTSSDNPKDREIAAGNGASLYLTKPCDLDGFLSLGERLVRDEFPRLGGISSAS